MKGVHVRLVKKFAEMIDGVDLSSYSVGASFRVPADQARLLIAEGWAVAVDSSQRDSDSKPQTELDTTRERTVLSTS